MSLRQNIASDLLVILFLLLAPLVMFHQQTLGGRTLLPSENLYQHLPYSAYRDVVKAPSAPHNHLLSDMVLQNYQWKRFIRAQIEQGRSRCGTLISLPARHSSPRVSTPLCIR